MFYELNELSQQLLEKFTCVSISNDMGLERENVLSIHVKK